MSKIDVDIDRLSESVNVLKNELQDFENMTIGNIINKLSNVNECWSDDSKEVFEEFIKTIKHDLDVIHKKITVGQKYAEDKLNIINEYLGRDVESTNNGYHQDTTNISEDIIDFDEQESIDDDIDFDKEYVPNVGDIFKWDGNKVKAVIKSVSNDRILAKVKWEKHDIYKSYEGEVKIVD